MPLTLRLGTPDDADRCGTISYKAFKTIAEHHSFPPGPSAPERTVANFARRLYHPGYHVIVAELDGHIVGSNVLWSNSISPSGAARRAY
jgi:hypothetical protein